MLKSTLFITKYLSKSLKIMGNSKFASPFLKCCFIYTGMLIWGILHNLTFGFSTYYNWCEDPKTNELEMKPEKEAPLVNFFWFMSQRLTKYL